MKWLPTNASTALTSPGSTFVDYLPWWAGGLVLLGYAAVLAGVGVLPLRPPRHHLAELSGGHVARATPPPDNWAGNAGGAEVPSQCGLLVPRLVGGAAQHGAPGDHDRRARASCRPPSARPRRGGCRRPRARRPGRPRAPTRSRGTSGARRGHVAPAAAPGGQAEAGGTGRRRRSRSSASAPPAMSSIASRRSPACAGSGRRVELRRQLGGRADPLLYDGREQAARVAGVTAASAAASSGRPGRRQARQPVRGADDVARVEPAGLVDLHAREPVVPARRARTTTWISSGSRTEEAEPARPPARRTRPGRRSPGGRARATHIHWRRVGTWLWVTTQRSPHALPAAARRPGPGRRCAVSPGRDELGDRRDTGLVQEQPRQAVTFIAPGVVERTAVRPAGNRRRLWTTAELSGAQVGPGRRHRLTTRRRGR